MTGEAEDKGIVSLNQPEEEFHVCRLCNCPDHRACGCEAKAKTAIVDKVVEGIIGQQALKVDPPAANIADAVRAATKAGMSIDEKIEATGEALSQIIENRDMMLETHCDIVEQLKIIATKLTVFVNLCTKKANEDIVNGGPHGN
jgi:hypothetical protein